MDFQKADRALLFPQVAIVSSLQTRFTADVKILIRHGYSQTTAGPWAWQVSLHGYGVDALIRLCEEAELLLLRHRRNRPIGIACRLTH